MSKILRNKLKYYYKKDLYHLYRFIIPKGTSNLILNNTNITSKRKYEYLVLDNIIGKTDDIQYLLSRLKANCSGDTKLVISYYNHLWEPILKLASLLGIREKDVSQNWLNNDDIANLLYLSGYDVITKQKRLLLPIYLPFISRFVNTWIAPLPLINNFCLTTWVIATPILKQSKELSASIVVAAKNEEGNIPKIIPRIPKFCKKIEVIFVEGNSSDMTWDAIQKEIKKTHKNVTSISAFKQKGKGKGDAVRLGFSKAKGDILMILDADMTMPPEDLPKFYGAIISGKGEFINGSRLVYPMDRLAMQFLNKIGNRTFSLLFTWILGQRFTDTLCGTKVIKAKHYKLITKNRRFFGDFDPFGDFDLIFGAVKQNLKVVEIPVRYKERVYGSTNISRVKHALLLFRMTWMAYRKFKAW